MSTDTRLQYADETITQGPSNGGGIYSMRQNTPSISNLKQRTATEKEVEAGEDDRDIKRKQARWGYLSAIQMPLTDAFSRNFMANTCSGADAHNTLEHLISR